MNPPGILESCADCGTPMTISLGPGRTQRYRGQDGYEVPADLAFPVCSGCGAEWLTSDQIDVLGDAMEAQRQARASVPQ